MKILSEMIEKINPFVQCYKQMHEKEKDDLALTALNPGLVIKTRMYIGRTLANQHPGRYNQPSIDIGEVAAVFVDNESLQDKPISVRVYPKYSKESHSEISYLSNN
jgi:hypothetical protein